MHQPFLVRFGQDLPPYPLTNKPIDDDVYHLIRSTPKVIHHDHYNGSMPLPLIKWSFFRDLVKGKRLGSIDDLSISQLREQYRITRAEEYGKVLNPDQYEAEDQADKAEKVNGKDTSKLGQYITAYERIPKMVKSVHYAYLGALEYANKMALHNVRYFELRTNPLPEQEVTKSVSELLLALEEKTGIESHQDMMHLVKKNNGVIPDYLISALKKEFTEISTPVINQIQSKLWAEKGQDETFPDLIQAIKHHLTATPEQLVKAIQMGIEDGKEEYKKSRKHLDYGLLLLAYRHGSSEINPKTGRMYRVDKAMDVARIAIELKKKGYPIAGVDLAGAEVPFPVTDYAPFFELIHEYNRTADPDKRLGITIHAGETKTSGELSGWQSVAEAIKLGWRPYTPVRMGHGVELMKSAPILEEAFEEFKTNPDGWMEKYPIEHILDKAPLLKEIIDKNIGLEMCIKSNRHTGIIPFHTEHPALFLSRLGAKVSINTDNMVVDNTDPTNELVKLYKYQNMNHADRRRVAFNALETAFIMDPEKRMSILNDMRHLFHYIERNSTMRLAMHKESHNEKAPSKGQILRMELSSAWHIIQQSFKDYLKR